MQTIPASPTFIPLCLFYLFNYFLLPSDAKSAAENHFELIDGIQSCEIQFERAATCSIMFLFLFLLVLFRSLPLVLLLVTVAN